LASGKETGLVMKSRPIFLSKIHPYNIPESAEDNHAKTRCVRMNGNFSKETMMGFRILAAVFAGLLLLAAQAPAEESSIADLLAELRSPEQSVRLRAIDTLATRGVKNPEVLAALTARLQDSSPTVRIRAAEALRQRGRSARSAGAALAEMATDANVQVRRTAVRAIRDIQPDPKVVVPVLTRLVNDPDPAVRVAALDSLTAAGKGAVPQLIEVLQEQDKAYWACQALGEIGPDASAAVPMLTKLLATAGSTELRREAALTLGAIGKDASEAAPLLVKTLEDPDYGVRMAAVFAIGRIGPAARSAESSLKRMLAGAQPPLMRTLTVWALARIKPDDKQATERATLLLVESMWSRESRVRQTSIRGLADLHASPDMLVPTMAKIIEAGPLELRLDALRVLENVGEPAVPTVVRALRLNDVRLRAIAILGRLGAKSKAAVEPLTNMALRGDAAARREALLALGAIGPNARDAVPAATKALKDPDAAIRYAACFALGRMGDAAMEAKPALQQELDSDEPRLVIAAAWALARIDPDCSQMSPKYLPRLIEALGDEDPLIRLEAATSMRCLGVQARPAAEILSRTAKEDPNELVRDMAAEALRATR
jgi:HEAT repeat protein